jgi:hypothetical protein
MSKQHNTLHAQDKFCEELEENDECEFVIEANFNFQFYSHISMSQFLKIKKKIMQVLIF